MAATGSGPYQAIVERNVFGLKPPPAPVAEAPPPAPPLKITLTGITTILGNKRALMSVAVPNKPPETYMLTEGQRQGEIEVLSIDERGGAVLVKNHGIEQTLDFKTDGAKAQPPPVIPGMIPPPNRPANPMPLPLPGTPQQPGGVPQLPQPNANANPGLPSRQLPMPMRSLRVPAGSEATPAIPPAPPQPDQ